ncbi:MAG: TIGR01906 family membrane protein [Chloroflexota bacterium]
MKNFIKEILSWLITILVPIWLLMTAIRILITPVYPMIEYRMPGFPEDTFGFTLEDRFHWAKPSIEYLVNSNDISFLAELRFDDGTAIYNERELSHMADVKVLVQLMIKVWLGISIFFFISGIVMYFAGWRDDLKIGYKRGGWASVGLVITMLLLVLVNFNQLFNWFHLLFFKGDTWLFYYSDTLIRLFPLRFWQDAFIFIGLFCLLDGFLLAFLVMKKKTIK